MKKTNLYLLTGFLGSGKTTFLLNLLNHLSDKKVGVIMNEFGKIGIDGTIIKKDGMELIELNRGSVFCSCLKVPFIKALMEMAGRKLDYLLVESSGLADPSNIGIILDEIKRTQGDIIDYKGAVCIVDAKHYLELSGVLETLNRQIKHCHLVIINKVDLVDDNILSSIISKIKNINENVEIAAASYCNIGFEFLEKNLMVQQAAEPEDTTNSPDNKPNTYCLTFEDKAKKDELTAFLNTISGDTYRIKGFFMLEEGWTQVDVVNAKIDYKPSDTEVTSSKLVIISKIGPKIIKPIFSAWQKTIRQNVKLQ